MKAYFGIAGIFAGILLALPFITLILIGAIIVIIIAAISTTSRGDCGVCKQFKSISVWKGYDEGDYQKVCPDCEEKIKSWGYEPIQ